MSWAAIVGWAAAAITAIGWVFTALRLAGEREDRVTSENDRQRLTDKLKEVLSDQESRNIANRAELELTVEAMDKANELAASRRRPGDGLARLRSRVLQETEDPPTDPDS